jgi:hypothetical protein
MDNARFAQCPDGTWYTASIVEHGYDDRVQTAPTGSAPAELMTVSYSLQGIAFAPDIGDNLFNPSPDRLPIGVRVRDQCNGAEYNVGEGPVLDDRIQDLLDRALQEFPLDQRLRDASPDDPRQLFRDEGILRPRESKAVP